ncbi:MAG: hypothetical protein ACOH5I_02290 [Oligoflexus sp.]
MISRFFAIFPTLLFTILSTISTVSLVLAKHAYDARQADQSELVQMVSVLPPSTRPELSQESIDVALAMFDIQIPANTLHPEFDPLLEDRGLTTMRGWGRKLEVTVGPAAFTSWGLLGSTLAHELEVHCQQNFAMIRLKDLFGMEGTSNAEREAYLHELNNADRFHLNGIERMNIQATMDFYYPSSQAADQLSAR